MNIINEISFLAPLFYIYFFIYISAWIDAEHLKDNDYIESHTSRWLLRALFVIAASNNVKELIGMTLMFSALFDTTLNKMRGIEIFYLGKTAYWDRFWRQIPVLYIIFKAVCLITATYLLLI